MEPTQSKQIDPVVRFVDREQELTEQEFLTRHPESSVAESVAALRSRYTSDRCTCHGKPTEYHVDGVSDGGVTFTINWCEEEFERNANERRARRAAQDNLDKPIDGR